MKSPKLRNLQSHAIDSIEKSIKNGAKHIFVQAPTGTGKSIIALELAKRFKKESYILTADFFLQQQYEETIKDFSDYSLMQVIASGNQYTCAQNGKKVKTHGECILNRMKIADAAKLECASKCKYFHKRIQAPISKSIITNYAFFLKHMNYTYDLLNFGKDFNDISELKQSYSPLSQDGYNSPAPFIPRKYVILDEAHRLPEQVQNAFAFEIGTSSIKNLVDAINECREDENIYLPIFSIKWGKIIKSLNELLACKLKDKMSLYRALFKFRSVSKNTYSELIPETKKFISTRYEPKKVPPKVMNVLTEIQNFENIFCKVDDYLILIDKHGINNLIVSYTRKNHRQFNFLKDSDLCNSTFHKFGEVFIYMTATLGDAKVYAKHIGVKDFDFINLDPEWDFTNSPIVFCNSEKFNHANKEMAFAVSASTVKSIINKHKSLRGIIHTGTYEYANYLKETLNDERLITYNGTNEKIQTINAILSDDLPDNAIITGPSLFEGVDLPDEYCRFQIIAKLQYPNLQNALWAKRCYSSDRYIYIEKPFIDLIQAIGRGKRNKDDFSITYLLDGRFKKYLNKRRMKSLPSSWESRFRDLQE